MSKLIRRAFLALTLSIGLAAAALAQQAPAQPPNCAASPPPRQRPMR